MKRISFIALTLLVTVMGTQAKSWKVGPNSVVGMDFTSINDAMSKITAGDTLYLDQYYNESNEQTVTKRVVIIGTGYDTSQTDEQVVARLTGNLILKVNNISVKSVLLNNVQFFADNCSLDRCYTGIIQVGSTTAGMNHVYSCYVTGRIQGYSESSCSKLDVQNCVIIDNSCNFESKGCHNLFYLTESIINHNIIYKSINQYYTPYADSFCLSYISNSQITNNVIYGYNSGREVFYNRDMAEGVYASGSGNTIEHNIFSGTIELSYFPENKTGWRDKWESIFVCEGKYSDYYRLATDSGDNPAVGYATDGGEVGCHGGMFGCPAGGRPQYIPYFTKVTVGSRVENGKLPVSVTIKIQDE